MKYNQINVWTSIYTYAHKQRQNVDKLSNLLTIIKRKLLRCSRQSVSVLFMYSFLCIYIESLGTSVPVNSCFEEEE